MIKMLSAEEKVAEIRRLYYQTSRATIKEDFAKAIDLLKSMPSEEERERVAVYMDGLSQMSRWARRGKKTGKRKEKREEFVRSAGLPTVSDSSVILPELPQLPRFKHPPLSHDVRDRTPHLCLKSRLRRSVLMTIFTRGRGRFRVRAENQCDRLCVDSSATPPPPRLPSLVQI